MTTGQGCSSEQQPLQGFFLTSAADLVVGIHHIPLCASVSPLLGKGEGCLLRTLYFFTAAALVLSRADPSSPIPSPRLRLPPSPGQHQQPQPKADKPVQVPQPEGTLLARNLTAKPCLLPKILSGW